MYCPRGASNLYLTQLHVVLLALQFGNKRTIHSSGREWNSLSRYLGNSNWSTGINFIHSFLQHLSNSVSFFHFRVSQRSLLKRRNFFLTATKNFVEIFFKTAAKRIGSSTITNRRRSKNVTFGGTLERSSRNLLCMPFLCTYKRAYLSLSTYSFNNVFTNRRARVRSLCAFFVWVQAMFSSVPRHSRMECDCWSHHYSRSLVCPISVVENFLFSRIPLWSGLYLLSSVVCG